MIRSSSASRDSPGSFTPLTLQRSNSSPSTSSCPTQPENPTVAVRRRFSSDHHYTSTVVPKPHRRCCTLPMLDLVRTKSESSNDDSISSAASSEMSTRSVNLFDLIDEEFVLNRCVASAPKSEVHRRRRVNILDMIDRIVEEDEDGEVTHGKRSSTSSSSFMTERSYPRGVFVVPPTSNRYLKAGNVGFVAAEAFDLWTE
ncbi:hypothetical protein IV203_026179 [Nitzschia inconspicua]|uniref:Uncharacterized protein n=1 Tax=Nitzschia inconspicua TaxID=303405 RepID=A0A9K3PZN0_9STRA|nr:hypothetical protein IV203_026179 [Nitzschia inconspicua]